MLSQPNKSDNYHDDVKHSQSENHENALSKAQKLVFLLFFKLLMLYLKKKRCRHWPNCKEHDKCQYYHPTETVL